MSVLSLALQTAATGALLDAMPSWVRVAMEPAAPLDLADKDNRVIVAVFIGDETMKAKRRRWQDASVTVELVLQVILPAEVNAVVGGKTTVFNTTGGGIRPVYAAVHRIVERVFCAPEDDGQLGTWGAILQSLIVEHDDELVGLPGVAERPGKRPVPVWDYSIPCRLIKSPPIGREAPRPWPQLVARMRATPDFADAADHVEALLSGEPLPPWRAEQARAGLSRIEGDALGLGTVNGAGEAPEAVRFTIDTGRGLIVEEREP